MHKLSKILLGAVLGFSLLSVPVGAQAAGNCVEYLDSNLEDQNYSRWASPVQSYLTTASDNRLMLVQAGAGVNGVAVVYYDNAYNFQSSRVIPQELPIFGAFYETESYYFLLTGQENPTQDASVEVYRITKYDKSWNRISSAGLYDCNTTVPFDAGSARMAQDGKYLLIHTCHEMYQSSDGRNHQANVTIQVDMDSMTITDSLTAVSNSGAGYVSHSFNQFIQLENHKIVTLDHGDAYPRSAVILKYNTDITGGTFRGYGCKAVNVLEFPGAVGENATGATLGGFEIAENYYLVAGNSVKQDDENLSRTTRNVFVAAVDKDASDAGGVQMHWLTDYAEGDGTTSTPVLVKISSEKYMVLWSREDVVSYTLIDGAGNRIGDIYQTEGKLSDCVPLVAGNKVIWYTWGSSKITFYEIDLNHLASVAKQERGSGHDYVSGGISDGYANLNCSVCGTSDRVKVYESFMVFFNQTGNGTFSSALPKELEVGGKIYCLYSRLDPSDAEDVIEVLVDNPSVVAATDNGKTKSILTLKGAGTANVTFRSKYNPSVSHTYKIVVEGDAASTATPAPNVTPTPNPGNTPTATPAPNVTPTPNPGNTATPAPDATPTPNPGNTPTATPAPELNGLKQASDGRWYYYENGRVNTDCTGLVEDETMGWWYVENGEVNFDYSGLKQYGDGWWCVAGGRVAFEYTGLWEDPIYGWWYVENGAVRFDYNGLKEYGGGWWCVAGGRVAFEYTGLWEDPIFSWWYVENGSVNFDYNGLKEYGGGWWCVSGGRVDFNYTGLQEDSDQGWWYVENGSVNFDYNGLKQYGDSWWCVAGGRVAFEYTGLWGDPDLGWWYVENGAVNFGYNGFGVWDGVTYEVVNGRVQY